MRVGVLRLRGDLAIDGHRRVLALHLEMVEQPVHVEPLGQLHLIAVDAHDHKKPHLDGCGGWTLSVPRSISLRWNYPVQVRGVPGRTRFSGILPPRRQGGVYHRAGGTRAQASVSWRPGLAITRDSAPSTQLAPAGSTTDAERT